MSGAAAESTASAGTEDKSSSLWSILPSFDPSSDDPKEYSDKIRFLAGVCPPKDKPMLAPRLAMLMRGTAWAQVNKLNPSVLADPEAGVKALLEVISQWEDTEELQTYEKFEKAIYKIVQKPDESTMSFVNRLRVAFQDIDRVKVSEVEAFVLLRQSNLNAEDKKRVLAMAGGEMSTKKIDGAMRQLAPRVLVGAGANEAKKRVYPVNYVEEPTEEDGQVTANAFVGEEEIHVVQDDEGLIAQMAEQGDQDAILVAEFEDQLIDSVQDNPELSLCFSAYTEARTRIRERIRSRGFWPPSKGGGKGKAKKGGSSKGWGNQRRRQSLADRIASSNCRLCGARGHWKQECPQRSSHSNAEAHALEDLDQDVEDSEIVDEIPGDFHMSKWNRNQWAAWKKTWKCSMCSARGHSRIECPLRQRYLGAPGGYVEDPYEEEIEQYPKESYELDQMRPDEDMMKTSSIEEPETEKAGWEVRIPYQKAFSKLEFSFATVTNDGILRSLRRGFKVLSFGRQGDCARHSPTVEPVFFVDQGCPAILHRSQ